MDVTDKQIMEIAQHAFTRMDGAWFLALTKKFGIQTAWEMDVKAWKQFSYVFGKNLRKLRLPIRSGRKAFWMRSIFSAGC